jgi:hypothetical protein
MLLLWFTQILQEVTVIAIGVWLGLTLYEWRKRQR